MSNTDQPACPRFEHGQILPAFTLPGTDGMPHSPWDYKQRQHLLLLITASSRHTSVRHLLQSYAQHYKAFREEQCAILAITADPVITNLQTQETLHLPFPLLSDPSGKVLSRYTQWDDNSKTPASAAILANRYNAIQEQWPTPDTAILPAILETLQYLNSLCTP